MLNQPTEALAATGVRDAASSREQTRPRLRLWEIDAARGLAVVLMAFFHLMWDLQFFGLSDVDVFSPGWQLFARGIGSTFIFLLGLSLTLDAARRQTATLQAIFVRNLKRAAQILACALLVTIVTYFLVGDAFVRFGILHLAGVSIVLATPFLRLPPLVNLIVGVAVLALGAFVPQIESGSAALLPLGLVPPGMMMVDYYPLVPWFGMVLLGVAFGAVAYSQGQRRFALPDSGDSFPIRVLRFLGRHSLAAYLLHQPILIAIVFVFSRLIT